MQTHLSYMMPVWQACDILGHDYVYRIGGSYIRLKESTSNAALLSSSSTSNTYNNGNGGGLHNSALPPRPIPRTPISDDDIRTLCDALCYHNNKNEMDRKNQNNSTTNMDEDHSNNHSRFMDGSGTSNNHDVLLPESIVNAWKKWCTHPQLMIDQKNLFIQFVVPTTVQPHPGPTGHMGLFDCFIYSLQGHAAMNVNPANTISNNSYYSSNNNSSSTTATSTGGGGQNSNSTSTSLTSPTIWVPDILILFAITKNYREFRIRQKHKILHYRKGLIQKRQLQQLKLKQQEQQQQQQQQNETVTNDGEEKADHPEKEKEEEVGIDNSIDTSSSSHEDLERSLYSLSPGDRKIIWTMAQLAFRIYDSYQKKGGIIQRDTIHRFLTDVHGEDSYKAPKNKALLDTIFAIHTNMGTNMNGDPLSAPINHNSNNTTNYLQATIQEQQFCKRVLDTVRVDDLQVTHLLLDWIALLGCSMSPLHATIPESITAYVDTMIQNEYYCNNTGGSGTGMGNLRKNKVPVCLLYELAENRLYEIKRKFHSMVAKSTSITNHIIHGHPMSDPAAPITTSVPTNTSTNRNSSNGNVRNTSNGGLVDSNAISSGSNTTGNNNSNTNTSSSNKVISCQHFVQTLSTTNEELGSGGYLPESLAKLVFRAGCNLAYNNNNNGSSTNLIGDSCTNLVNNNTPSDLMSMEHHFDTIAGWGLYNVLKFGCMAVRHDESKPQEPDIPLLRFLFTMFQSTTSTGNVDVDTTTTTQSTTDDNESYVEPTTMATDSRHILNRRQIARMLQLLAEYAVFRRRADFPPIELDDSDYENDDGDDDVAVKVSNITLVMDSYEERTMVDMSASLLLGLIPPDYKPKSTPHFNESKTKGKQRAKVPLKVLIDYTLDGTTAKKDQMTFSEFTTWHSTKMTEIGPRTRLGPLMTELRLIAAVQFGIPPVLASMEITLIAEIERRHKLRYPQTDLSRRGPRGTVWHIIDSLWFNSWANLVKKTAGTPLDNQDGRGSSNNTDRTRTLNRIRNAGLLIDNGSLALRADIRWKHDYEILPPLAWSALQAWYDGGPPIHRTVVKYVANNTSISSPHSSKPVSAGRIPTENEIELYPLFVTVYLCDSASRGEAKPFQQNFQLSRVSPILVMLVQLCKELDVSPDQARLWVVGNKENNTTTMDGNSTNTTTTSSTSSLTRDNSSSSIRSGIHGFSPSDDWILGLELSIIEQIKRRGGGAAASFSKDTIVLLLELKDRDTGLWPRGVDGKEWAFRRNEKSTSSITTVKSDHGTSPSDLGDGIVGLYNMGNTCYLNASIQCLSHTPVFREYFTSKAYLNDINTSNPLGHEGRLAQVTATLINSLWKRFNNQSNDPTQHHKRVTAPGSYALVTAPALTPKTFKESLSKFNEIFQGNEQHDAQELLAFLLGGLSEDLNRIVDKPYIEAPDSDGRPDSELADIWWSNHLKREMSIIVALFTGQYKSLLTCRTCKYESARFEPFSFLQVPLPEDDNLTVSLILYPCKEKSCAMKYCVRARNDGKLRDVLIALAKVLHQDEIEEENKNLIASNQKMNTIPTEEDNGDDTESSLENNNIYMKKSQNFAIVDMRDGYISKIAPNSWLLHDLQNKDTGELPLLHVFELDPLPEDEPPPLQEVPPNGTNETKIDNANESKTVEGNKPNHAYLAIAQRRSELTSTEYLHPLVHRVFGSPLLLRINDLENCTGRELYDIVAKRLRNFVPSSVHRFLSSQPTDSSVVKGENADEDPSESSNLEATLLNEQEKLILRDVSTSVYRTTTDMEEVSAALVPRYGFRIRLTTRDGRRCLSCPWYECCIGCLVPDDDKPTVLMDGDSAVIDWHFAVDVASNGFGLRSSLIDTNAGNSRQLKNLATVTVKNHSSCGTGVNRHSMLQQPGAVTLEECLDAFAKEEKIPEAYCSKCKDFRVQTKRMSLWRLPPVVIIHLKRFQFTQHMRRKLRDLVVFPIEGLDLSRIMAPTSKRTKSGSANESDPDSTTNDRKDDGRSEMLYDLYGVVHHQGALSGGHYVASLKSELDGQFRLFNDAQIFEIHPRDIVDSSAYILFYIRRDVAKAKLSDFWNVREEGNGLSKEDMDHLIKGRNDRCVIS